MLENVQISFTFKGEFYKVSLGTLESKKSAAYNSPKTESSCLLSLDEFESKLPDPQKGWVNVTLLNDVIDLKRVGRTVSSYLEHLGFTERFRIKVDGRYHYIRYCPFLISKEDVLKEMKKGL